MTPKVEQVKEIYRRNFPDSTRYRYWTVTFKHVPDPPVEEFIYFKLKDGCWAWGMNGDFTQIEQWRKKNRGALRPQKPKTHEILVNGLTQRQRTILEKKRDIITRVGKLNAQGYNGYEISDMLNISYHKVTGYRKKFLTHPDFFAINTTETE